jgi:hypothetical protein
MKKLVCAVLILIVVPTAGFADNLFGQLSLYSDANFAQCTLTDNEPRLADVYVVHHIGPIVGNAYLLRFKLTASVGFTGSWIQDTAPTGMSVVGTSPTGMSIGYQSCRTGDVQVVRVTYQMIGTSSPCAFLRASPYTGADFIETWNCSFDSFGVSGGTLIINSDGSCPCQGPVPVEPTTWGQVKSLYR